MTIQQILQEKVQGVWSGTYTIIKPNGEVIEQFLSRQEGRMDGNQWTERVVYYRVGQEPYEHFYAATVNGDSANFHNPDMWGETSRVGMEAVVFAFGWNSRPRERIIEVTRPDGDYRTRIWQHFVDGELDRMTIIEERRIPGEQSSPDLLEQGAKIIQAGAAK